MTAPSCSRTRDSTPLKRRPPGASHRPDGYRPAPAPDRSPTHRRARCALRRSRGSRTAESSSARPVDRRHLAITARYGPRWHGTEVVGDASQRKPGSRRIRLAPGRPGSEGAFRRTPVRGRRPAPEIGVRGQRTGLRRSGARRSAPAPPRGQPVQWRSSPVQGSVPRGGADHADELGGRHAGPARLVVGGAHAPRRGAGAIRQPRRGVAIPRDPKSACWRTAVPPATRRHQLHHGQRRAAGTGERAPAAASRRPRRRATVLEEVGHGASANRPPLSWRKVSSTTSSPTRWPAQVPGHGIVARGPAGGGEVPSTTGSGTTPACYRARIDLPCPGVGPEGGLRKARRGRVARMTTEVEPVRAAGHVRGEASGALRPDRRATGRGLEASRAPAGGRPPPLGTPARPDRPTRGRRRDQQATRKAWACAPRSDHSAARAAVPAVPVRLGDRRASPARPGRDGAPPPRRGQAVASRSSENEHPWRSVDRRRTGRQGGPGRRHPSPGP